MMQPSTRDFRDFLLHKLAKAEARGEHSITIQAGDLHAELGGYADGAGSDHRMPSCCAAMRSVMVASADTVLHEPPSGKGASLSILYKLPRPLLPVAGTRPLRQPAHKEHANARQALPLIAKAAIAGKQITYQDLAIMLGRDPQRDVHALGQACDLLDCAATLACRPLIAFWTVLTKHREHNPEAWKDNPELRNALLQQAESHTFTDQDTAAISVALDKLRGMGRKAAWESVREQLPEATMLARLQGKQVPQEPDAINDHAGTDEPGIEVYSGQRYLRDPKVRAKVLERAGGYCEYCGKPGFERTDGGAYLECHHIIALANDGADRMSNVIALCAEDHRKAHFSKDRAALERRMTNIVAGKVVQAKLAAK